MDGILICFSGKILCIIISNENIDTAMDKYSRTNEASCTDLLTLGNRFKRIGPQGKSRAQVKHHAIEIFQQLTLRRLLVQIVTSAASGRQRKSPLAAKQVWLLLSLQ